MTQQGLCPFFGVSAAPDVLRWALIVVAGAAAFLPMPGDVMERGYSTTLYPRLQAVVTSASNLVPVALFDALIIVSIVCWVFAFGFDILGSRHGWARVFLRLIVRTLVWAAAFYIVFLLMWGLNYRRTPLHEKLQFESRAVSADAARSAAIATVDALNALHGQAHAAGWRPLGSVDASLTKGFDRVHGELGLRSRTVTGRPKATLLDPYFRRAGVSGMTDPYFLETLVEQDLLPFERPFVVAHEWSHLAGFADESEASFVGWLTCLRGSIPDQYSGWLFLYGELADAVGREDGVAVAQRLGPGPRADLRAIAERRRRQVNPTVSAAGWRVYDQYLKANRVEAGAASYGEVVRLVLGVRFGPDWTPRLRKAPQ
jgi:Protein of unknown function (DUF3810)